jgi:cytochrome P450
VDRLRHQLDGGTADFALVAGDLPLFALAEVLGVPESDRYLLYDWSNRVIGYQDEDYASSAHFDASGGTPMAQAATALRPVPGPDGRLPNPRGRGGMPDLYRYAHELAEWKRRRPGDDVMSLLLAASDEQGGEVTSEEFENMFWLFAVAGNETLRNGIPGGMASLLAHPDAYRRLRADPGLIGTSVEEMLRWWPPVMHFRRTATEDTEVAGQPVRAGDKVVVFHVSANRDPAAFSEPDRFDIERRPNDHVSFGFGVHFCLGAHLARAQMRALLGQVAARLPELEPAGPVVRLTSNFQNGVKHLPVRLATGR